MSEQYFLEKCIQSVEDVKGSYKVMSNLDLDPVAQKMYTDMVSDVSGHLKTLKNRMNYLKQQSKQ